MKVAVMFEEREKRKIRKKGGYRRTNSEMKERQSKRKENELGNKEERK